MSSGYKKATWKSVIIQSSSYRPRPPAIADNVFVWPSPESETLVIAPFTRSLLLWHSCCAWTCTVIYYIESLRTTLQSLHTRHIDFPLRLVPRPLLLRLATAACGICYNSYAWLIMSPSLSHTRFFSFPHWYQADWPPFGPLTRLVRPFPACCFLLRLVINEPPLAAFNNARLSINLAWACSDSGLAYPCSVLG